MLAVLLDPFVCLPERGTTGGGNLAFYHALQHLSSRKYNTSSDYFLYLGSALSSSLLGPSILDQQA